MHVFLFVYICIHNSIEYSEKQNKDVEVGILCFLNENRNILESVDFGNSN